MLKKKLGLPLVICLALFHFQTVAASTINWVVANVSGQAIITKLNKEPQWIKVHDLIGAGDVIKTLNNGTVGLTRNSEAMVISSNSELQMPLKGNDNSVTTIFQKLGTVLFSVKKKNKKHFKVITPYMAAVVKGTTFVVNVKQSAAQIQVFEGLVECKAENHDKVYLINTGNKALIPRNYRQKIVVTVVNNASNANPYFGGNIERLSKFYLNKIRIGGGDRFTRNIANSTSDSNGIKEKANGKKDKDTKKDKKPKNGGKN